MSNSSRSSRAIRPSSEAGFDPAPPKAAMNSPSRPTEPTVMVGLPVSFLIQPAKFRSEPSNSGSQKRRCEPWKTSTPASDSGVSHWVSSSGV